MFRTSPKIGTVAATLMLLSLIGLNVAPANAQFAKNHPRRAEVLGRDRNINNRINADRGNLGGHYGQLKREDRAIRRQEQRDARRNGGFITKGQQRQLNREENRENRQINRDFR